MTSLYSASKNLKVLGGDKDLRCDESAPFIEQREALRQIRRSQGPAVTVFSLGSECE